MQRKSRKVKEDEYQRKFGHIPIDYHERLSWMDEFYNLSEKQRQDIINKRDAMLQQLFFYDIKLVLFEMPEGTPRSRFRIINRGNFIAAAIENPQFVHVYSPGAKEDFLYMKRLTESELQELSKMICTPCEVHYCTYHKTPTVFNTTDTFLSEIGLQRPMIKPDWDNLGKKYSDMSNHTIWLDDSFVMDGHVSKFYSILPRIEINIRYLNMVYNKYQYNAVSNRKDFKEFNCELEYFKWGR